MDQARKKRARTLLGWAALIALILLFCFRFFGLFTGQSRFSRRWAASLDAEEIRSIELVVMPSAEHERYRSIPEAEFPQQAALLRQSGGLLLWFEPAEKAGGTATLYLTMQDGIRHQAAWDGEFLTIDGDSYLPLRPQFDEKWAAAGLQDGAGPLPDDFLW